MLEEALFKPTGSITPGRSLLMQILLDRRALHILEYELETLMLHRMPMLHGPKHCQRQMVVGEALISKLMPLIVEMNFQVHDYIP
ncbi:MAG: hypothetical protein ACKPKO_14635, partial [Candidatus Fonsibacter sp.]